MSCSTDRLEALVRSLTCRLFGILDFYRPSLDELWDVFGEDRLIYGSNWPVSDLVAPYDAVFRVVHDYFAAKGDRAFERYFWKNSQAAYRWRAR